MTQTAEAEAPAEKALWVPQWAPWILTFVLMIEAQPDTTTRAYRIAVLAYLVTLLYTTTVCLLVGARCGSRARVYWFFIGVQTLVLGLASARFLPGELLFLAALLLAPVGLLILFARRLWFSPSFREPSRRIYGHVTSALSLLFLSFFPTECVRESTLDALKDPLLKMVPLLWILWTTLVAYRTVAKEGARGWLIMPWPVAGMGLLACVAAVLFKRL